nr:hypothetical protein KY997_03375 [Bacillus paralicheniformis]
MAKKFIKTIVSLLVFVLVMGVLSPLSQAIEEGKEDESIDFNSTLNTLNEIFQKTLMEYHQFQQSIKRTFKVWIMKSLKKSLIF